MVGDPVQSKRSLIMGGLALFVVIGLSQNGWTQEPGEQVFKTACFACHTIGGGRLVGPDLLSVHERRSQEWLESFVKSSQSMVNGGDAVAIELFEEFNRIPMPDSALKEQQIRQVLSYIKSQSSDKAANAAASMPVTDEVPAPDEPASEEDIQMGQELFQGKIRFANNGPACNACHEVRHDAVIGGGILARELTAVFTRMGGAGVKAILGQAPFPVMQAAYQEQAFTEDEIAALVAFLEFADSEQYNQLPRDYGIGLFVSGCVGAGVLFLLFGVVWRRRKKGSVYQAIFDRQIQSVTDR